MCNNNCCGMQNDCGCCGMQNNCGCGGSGFSGTGSWIWIILILILFCGFGSFGGNGCC